MQIKILNIISNKDSENYVVDFATEFGSGRAEWNGDPPVISHSYEVEFEINDDLEPIRKPSSGGSHAATGPGVGTRPASFRIGT